MKHDGVGEQHGRRNDRHTLDLLYNFRAQLDGKLVGIQLFTQNQMRVASGKSRTDDVDLLQRKALILKTGDPERSPNSVSKISGMRFPDSICASTREEKPSMEIMSGSMSSAGQSVSISSNSGL